MPDSKPKEPTDGVADLVDGFVQSRLCENTRLAYRKALLDFARSLALASEPQLLSVTTADVVRYRNALQRRGCSAATVNQRLAAVRGLYRRLLRERRIAANPADPELVEGLRTSEGLRSEGLSVEEVRRILATCDGSLGGLRDRALILTLYYEGLRRSEASKLNYRDLSTKRGLIEIRDAKNNPYETVRQRPEVRGAIEKYLEVLNAQLGRARPRPDDPVFCSLSKFRSFGGRLAPSSINDIVKRRARLAGVNRRVSAHSWRYTCATHGLAAGVPLHQVQRHLRHRDVRTTLRYDRERDTRRNPTSEALPPLDAT